MATTSSAQRRSDQLFSHLNECTGVIFFIERNRHINIQISSVDKFIEIGYNYGKLKSKIVGKFLSIKMNIMVVI